MSHVCVSDWELHGYIGGHSHCTSVDSRWIEGYSVELVDTSCSIPTAGDCIQSPSWSRAKVTWVSLVERRVATLVWAMKNKKRTRCTEWRQHCRCIPNLYLRILQICRFHTFPGSVCISVHFFFLQVFLYGSCDPSPCPSAHLFLSSFLPSFQLLERLISGYQDW